MGKPLIYKGVEWGRKSDPLTDKEEENLWKTVLGKENPTSLNYIFFSSSVSILEQDDHLHLSKIFSTERTPASKQSAQGHLPDHNVSCIPRKSPTITKPTRICTKLCYATCSSFQYSKLNCNLWIFFLYSISALSTK